MNEALRIWKRKTHMTVKPAAAVVGFFEYCHDVMVTAV
jgi:hypothetical protein